MVYADDGDIMCGIEHTIEKNTVAWVYSKDNIHILEMNTDNTKFILNSLGQNAERHEDVKNDDSSFTREDYFKRLGRPLKNNNSKIREIKNRWNSGYAYYHPVLNLMSSS